MDLRYNDIYLKGLAEGKKEAKEICKKERPMYESYINYIFSYFYDCPCI